MGHAPRLTYLLDLPEVTDGAHIAVRRRGSRASYANRPVGKEAFLARGESLYVPYCSLECQHQTRRLAEGYGG